MRSSRSIFRALGCSALLLAFPGPGRAALCGDVSGDGFVRTADALAALKLTVAGGYDRRGDVYGSVATPDGKLTASDALKLLKDAVAGLIPPCRGADATRVAVTTAPALFDSGGFAVVDIKTRTFVYKPGSVTKDAVIRTPNGKPVVVNRIPSETLQVFDLAKPSVPYLKDCSVADEEVEDTNIQDVLLLSSTKGYVTANAGKNLLVINPAVLFDPKLDPACDTIIQDRIDLSAFDGDGVPEMDQMVLVGTDLFVSMQLLDYPTVIGNGRIAVIDTLTDTVKGSIPLSFRNPFAQTKGLPYDEFRHILYVGGPGAITSADSGCPDDGGIEAIDPVTMQSAGMLLTGADLHSNIFDFVVVGTRRAFAIIADCATIDDPGNNSVVEIDLEKRKITRTLLSSSSVLITDIEMTELGELWVAYRGETPEDPAGLRVFDVRNDNPPATIKLGQAPFTLSFF